MNFDVFLRNLTRQVEDNPVVALGVGASLLAGLGRVLKVAIDARNSRTWSREVTRRGYKRYPG